MPKLNQIIAVVTGKKTRSQRLLTDAHQGWNKDAIAGISKIYHPKQDGGETLAPEHKQVQLDVLKCIDNTVEQLVGFFDAVATQETGNTTAKADITVGNKTILKDVPVTVLLFLEKQIEDMRTFAMNLPVLPQDRTWKWDTGRNCYSTDPVQSVRTQKKPKVIVKYDATKEHPAQTEIFMEDEQVGTFETTYLSSAIPSQRKSEIIARIEALQEGIKIAREAANSIEVSQVYIGKQIMQHIFGVATDGVQS